MIDDSIDCIDLQGQSLDSFRNQLIVKGMYDHFYEKEKYLMKQYQLIDMLQEMITPKYVNQSHSFLTLMINFQKERQNNQVSQDKDTQFITIFVYSLKYFSFQIQEFDYLYKLISATDRIGLKSLCRYFKIRKLIFSFIYDHRNTILFLDQYNLQFEEWSGVICRIFGSDQITQIGNQIRQLNQRFNQIDKIWKNSINSLDFIKICMKHSRQIIKNKSPSVSPNKNQPFNYKNDNQILPNFFQQTDYFNQRMSPQQNDKGIQASRLKTNQLNTSLNVKKDLQSVSSQSKSPQKPITSYKNQSLQTLQQGTTKNNGNSPHTNKAEIMNQAPTMFNSFFLESQRNEQKAVKQQYNMVQTTTKQNQQYKVINKDGILINCELANKYEELTQFTKELQATMKKGAVLSEEDISFISKKNIYESFVNNPLQLILQSVSSAPQQTNHENSKH